MEIIKLSKENSREIGKKAANLIPKGKILICPTDTVYGLICDATNKKAVEKLFKIKKRPKNKPLPIFVKDIKMAKELAEINEEQEEFLKKVWPGKITVVLERKPGAELYGVDKKTIALRVPQYRFVLNLVKHIGPLVGTSANISGQPASGNIEEVIKQFECQKHQPDFVIDEGDLSKSKPSKIVDLTSRPYKILRN